MTARAASGLNRIDAGLLILRICVGLTLFLKHGLEKISGFPMMAQHFPDPIHIGVFPSLVIATLSDAIASCLVIVGLFTRWAALYSFCNIAVAFLFVEHARFFGQGADHGELMVLYLGSLLTLVAAGGGRISLDAILRRRITRDG
jgi:putative oxidoreductase